uniref:Orc1-like AAA ATPase domain-containing protein n=1 Tax=Neogobius melanostomus TaxID=47308 RepID=A0A8C6WZI6_9GOBI
MTSSGTCASSSSLLKGRRFYCREWAVEKLRRCLDARSAPGHAPGVLITGGPGAGKTAMCTEIVWPTSKAGQASGLAQRCLAYHFCHREEQSSATAWRFVLGLVEQMRSSELLGPGYEEILKTPAVSAVLEPLVCQRDPEDVFKRAVLAPLLELPAPPQPLLLLVDALDLSPPVDTGLGAPSHRYWPRTCTCSQTGCCSSAPCGDRTRPSAKCSQVSVACAWTT